MSVKKLLPSALSIYEKYENNQLRISDLDREDLHFKLKTGADILIEENDLHTTKPFKLKVKNIYDWSVDQSENFETILEQYTKTYNGVKDELVNTIQPTYKPFFDEKMTENPETPDDILRVCRDRIAELRKDDDSFEAQMEVRHRKENIFDILYYESNKNLENLMIKTYLDHLTMTNNVTVLQSMYESVGKYTHKQRTYSIGELIEIMSDSTLNTNAKDNRPIVFPMTSGERTSGEFAYTEWSGLQVFDLDLKHSDTFELKYGANASKVRDKLFDKLKHYPWLLGITLSSSGKGCHVYTKVSRMHHLYETKEHNAEHAMFWFRMSYLQKHAAIAYILNTHCEIDIYNEKKVIDTAMAKISQGIAMNYDPEARWSTNFVDLYPAIFYHIPPEKGVQPEDWLLTPKILDHYSQWFLNNEILDEDNVDVQRYQGDLKFSVDDSVTLEGVSQIDMNQLLKGDKYTTRWRIVNTIIDVYGETDISKELCHHILQSKETHTQNTVESFIRSAVVNRKEANMGTIRQLRKLGLRIELEDESLDEISKDTLTEIKFSLDNSEYGFVPIQSNYTISLDDDQYLGMRMEEVLSNIKDFKVNVLESAPNTGKTEFFKTLAKTKIVCLVIPFTSTIESKIVSDDEINSLFDVFYGDRSISEMVKGRSAVMTFDKFSNMPKSKYDLFDYIAIDESHLLFTSTYRLPVVSQTIENIRSYLDQDVSEVRDYLSSVMSIQNLMGYVHDRVTDKNLTKFILMTGTITGELDYFKFYNLLNYVAVKKKHPHEKSAIVHISQTSTSRDLAIFHKIAESLENGTKVIHPTNKGDGYAERVVSCVKYILGRDVKYEYYKKANSDEDFLININKETTTNDIEILFCSDYLSVGIDIKDSGDFSMIYSNDFTAEAIEQFNNRLRSTNIECNIFYDVVDSEGGHKPNIINTRKIKYEHNDELGRMISDEKSIATLQQNIQNQNQYFAILGELFSKYFIQDFAGNIKYVRSAFEIEQFELQYTTIAKSLLYIKTSLERKYQYSVIVEKVAEYGLDQIATFSNIMDMAKNEHDQGKTRSFIQLVDFLGAEDRYNHIKIDSVKFAKDNSLIESDDDGLHFGYDMDIGGFVLTYHKKHKLMFDRARIFIKKMRKLYSQNTTNQIVRSCLKAGGVLNNTEIDRYQKLVTLIFDDRKMTLSTSTRDMLAKSYEYVTPEDGSVTINRTEYEDLKMDLKEQVLESFKKMTKAEIKSQRRHDNISALVTKFVDTLFVKRVGRDNVVLEFRKVFNFDSMHIQNSIERDKIYNRLLLNQKPEDFNPNETNWIAGDHIQQDRMMVT